MPEPALLKKWISRLERARNPVLVLGSEVDAARAQPAAVALSEAQRLPVRVAPQPGRCPFPNTHPHFRGVLPAGIASISRLLAEHDLVLVVVRRSSAITSMSLASCCPRVQRSST